MTDDPRTFEDADGDAWEVRAQADFKWQFVPVDDGDRTRRIVTPPPEVDHPAGLDEEELRRLLQSGIPADGITEPTPPGWDG